MSEQSYKERTILAIKEQCKVRGIIVEAELDGVMAAIKDRYGKRPEDMNDSELKRLNRSLPEVFSAYLGGAKRR